MLQKTKNTKTKSVNQTLRKMNKSLSTSLLLGLLLMLISCDNNQVFDSYKSVGNSWHRDSIVTFDFEVQDTTQYYNLFLTVRANNNYPFSNIFLLSSIESPNNMVKTDTLEYFMASPDGKMLGNGFSDVK